MKSFPNILIQTILFAIPYVFTAMTCIVLMFVNLDEGTTTLRATGYFNGSLLTLYLVGLLGPHYLKVCCGLFNYAVSGILFYRQFMLSAIVLLLIYCVPAFVFVLQAIFVPSITQIVPGICLGNLSAAISLHWTKEFRITHILDLTGNAIHKNKDAAIKRIRVSDFLGSQGSLAAVTQECTEFIDKALLDKGNVLVHCSAGQSRSAALVLHYMMSKHGFSLKKAYSYVRAVRPVVDINSDHMVTLQALDARQSSS